MTLSAVSYGAVELKQAAQRYWITGFLISVALHAAILGALHFKWFDGGTDISGIQLYPPTIGVRISSTPVLPGIVKAPPISQTGAAPLSKHAVPAPVPDETVNPDQTMASQTELAQGVEPLDREGDGSVELPSLTINGLEDETPVPFEAVEKLPVIINRVTPVYPPLAIQAGIEGKVVVRLLVGKDGTVRQVVVEHSTAEILNDAALDAARLFRFTPAIMNNGPVTVWVVFPFTFRLR